MSNGTALEKECSLVVYATVISNPQKDVLICDAGAKCLGLDQGAHGNAAIKGHGRVVGHPELEIYALSEEVGKIHIEGETDYYIMVNRESEVEKVLSVDIRGNATQKGIV